MKIKGASAYSCIVKDLNATAQFYEKLGLEIKKRTGQRLIIYINWYRIDFFTVDKTDSPELQAEAKLDNRGAGLYLYFSIDDVDEAYEELVGLGFKPDGEPKDEPWGNREFILRDPDGYKLVFFKRKVVKNPLD